MENKIKLLDRKELAETLRMSVRSTYRIDDLPAAIKVGGPNGKSLFKLDEVNRFLEGKKVAK